MEKKTKLRRRLSFLRRFLKSTLQKHKSIPATIINPGTLKMAFLHDDMRVSLAKRIVAHFGYVLQFRMTPKTIPRKKARRNKDRHPYENLGFLRSFLGEAKISQAEFGERLGLTRFSVTYWFKEDDIRISRLYEIAYLWNADLFITISLQQPHSNNPTPSCNTKIILDETVDIDQDMLHSDDISDTDEMIF